MQCISTEHLSTIYSGAMFHVRKWVEQRRKPISYISRDACCFLSRYIKLLLYIFTSICPLAIPQSSPGCNKTFLRTEPTIPWRFNVSGQLWAQLNFYKNLLGYDRNSSPGNGPIHILSLWKKKTLTSTAEWKDFALSIEKYTIIFSESLHLFISISSA